MAHLIEKLTRWLNRRARIENTVKELEFLTDRELNDLGIHRADIYKIAKEAADNV